MRGESDLLEGFYCRAACNKGVSGVTGWGAEGRIAPLGKLNVKTGPPLSLYSGTVILWFTVSCFFAFS